MQISLRDFRSFHKTDYIDIKAINLLVGENSSGKTSFLAAIRFVFGLFGGSVDNSFNRYPYFLGSFEDIAHRRGGRFGRAPVIAFSVRGEISPSEIVSARDYVYPHPAKRKPEEASRSYQIDVAFENYRSQPRLSALTFRSGNYRVHMTFPGGKPTFSVKTPAMDEARQIEGSRFGGADVLGLNFSFLRYMFTDLIFTISRQERQPASETSAVESDMAQLAAYFTAAQSQISSEVYATAPVRTEPKRIYNPADISPTTEGDNAPILLAQMSAFDEEKWKRVQAGLNSFGKASGLFSSINVRHLEKRKNGPFQLTVSVGKSKSSIVDVGYGVSQALPIIYEILVRDSSATFLFQQPEVHLHPQAQAELASFIFRSSKDKRHTVFMETHSDHVIDRIRMDVRDQKDVSVSPYVNLLYFRRNELDTDIIQMSITSDGIINNPPKGYRNFFLREQARSLGLTL
ncbi:AAA family ATPase [Tianweitania sp.]|uniref:AAA family ATPase n=1 Tax=Tianweitania sp. TaxID=2021634 RepID=UPI00289A8C58|nr:AAA family ATPase [Tianweitania sp.]